MQMGGGRALLGLTAQAAPGALVLGGVGWIAWNARGSFAARDFLPVAVLGALAAAAALLSGVAPRPARDGLLVAGALATLSAWAAASGFWAPVPALARDEALLELAGIVAFAIPLLTLRSQRAREVSLGVAALGAVLMAVGTVLVLHGGRPIDDVFRFRRLSFPVTYANAAAAFFLVGLWPGVVLGARRSLTPIVRALALGTASTSLAAAMLAQSKGAAIGLVVSLFTIVAVSPRRLRLLLSFAIAVIPVAVAFPTLTAPYRAADVASRGDVRAAANAVVLAGAAAVLAGAVYAVLDRRIEVGGRARRIAATLVAALVLVTALGGAAVFAIRVDDPQAWVSAKWRAFKHVTPKNTASTHLLEVGSNRYDFWRVAAGEWKRHPLVGDGARGFGPAYLIHGRSSETPARAHSLPFELLSEEGLVGLALALAAFGGLLTALGRRTRRADSVSVAALGSCTLALAHACVDWTFTFSVLTLPFFLVAGIGLAAGAPGVVRPLGRRAARIWGAGAVVLALLVFAPPWISAKLVRRGVEQRSLADLRWAHRFDPLTADPWIAEAQIATRPNDAIAPLERARARQPRSVGVRYLLGSVYFNARRFTAAEREFAAALRLDPRDRSVAQALRLTRARRAR